VRGGRTSLREQEMENWKAEIKRVFAGLTFWIT
jgi:hypothetical protein